MISVFSIATSAIILFASSCLAQERGHVFGGFDRITARAGVKVFVTTGKPFDIVAEARRGNLERLEITLRDRTLVISRDTSWEPYAPANNDRFRVYVSLPELISVESSAGAVVTIEGLSGPRLVARSAMGGRLRIDEAALGNVELFAATGGLLRIDGTCEQLNLESLSGAIVLADHLLCNTVEIDVSTGSTSRVFARTTADLRAATGSTLVLSGGAEIISQEKSSSSTIRSY